MRLLIHDYAGHPFQIQLSRELARRGYSVIHAFAGGLLTPRGSLKKKAEDPESLELVELPMDTNYRRDKYRFLRRRNMELEYGKKVAELIHSRKPDVVISANTPTEPQLKIAKACSQLGISFVPWVQDFYSVAVAKLAKKKLPVIGNLIGWWYRHLERCALRLAAAAVVITDDFVPMLQELGMPLEKITVIPNWAPLDELPQRPRYNAWSAANGWNDKFIFLYSGTLAMKHNPDILWKLAVSFKDNSQVRVVVISEGPGAGYLRERKSSENCDNLEILPFQSFEQMPDVMGAADVLLAILEPDAGVFSVPSKILTYHCAGRPVLAAIPHGNLAARIIHHEGSGFCVEPNDSASFILRATELRKNDLLRERCGHAARTYAVNHFEISAITNQFEGIFKKLIAEAKL
jgi:colanic acid biosynthesis glycosyl transferase WcaI